MRFLKILYSFIKYLVPIQTGSKINFNATIKLNFRLLPFDQAIYFPIIVIGKLRVTSLSGRIKINCPISRGLITIGKQDELIITQKGVSQLTLLGEIIVNGRITVGTDVCLIIQDRGVFEVGDNCRIGNRCNVFVCSNVIWGKCVRLSYESQLMSTNFHYVKDVTTGLVRSIYSDQIKIDDYCWIGNNSTIMPNTLLPKCTIVASHSLVNRRFNEELNCPIIGGVPAKVLTTGKVRVFSNVAEKIIDDYFRENIDHEYYDASNLEIF